MKTKQFFSIEMKPGHDLIGFCEYSLTAFVRIQELNGIRIAEYSLNEIAELYNYEFMPDPRNEETLPNSISNIAYFNKIMAESEDIEEFDSMLAFTY